MRFEGKLEKWNEDRGFGFIMPTRGGDTVFVHISAFPRDSGRPKVGEPLSFEVEPAGDGRRRAINVQRPGQRPVSRPSAVTRDAPPNVREGRGGSGFLGRLIPVVLVAALGVYGYTVYSDKRAQATRAVADEAPAAPAALPVAPAASPYRCDGRTHCSQMTSCEEAIFFLRNCPNAQMDGDGNGIPCERQWCKGPSRR
ncbi:MAG TPA: cold shock domain-containing protein [Burkholderiaceae bacterium]|nr:cold shock domain-containing protein [Burkholderiaceae bacterium]